MRLLNELQQAINDVETEFNQQVNRFSPVILPATAIHDYLCDREEYEKADKYFKEMLQLIDKKSWKYNFMAWAVKIYHKYIKKVY